MLFLVGGFYNDLIVAAPQHKGDKLYHPLIGTKILLAFGMFLIAFALGGRSKPCERMQRHSNFWQSAVLVVAALIVGISGFAKFALKPVKPAASSKPACRLTLIVDKSGKIKFAHSNPDYAKRLDVETILAELK